MELCEGVACCAVLCCAEWGCMCCRVCYAVVSCTKNMHPEKCPKICCLLRQNVPDLLIAEDDVVNGFSSVLEGCVVVVDVRGQEDLGVPSKALAGGKVRD